MAESSTPFSPDLNSSRPLSIMIVAGEASGEKHGAALARALHDINPEANIFGAGSDEMRAASVDTVVDIRDLAIIGVPEIARALPRFFRAYRSLVNAAHTRRPDVVVLIDWPDFNLRLAKRLHRDGFKIVYYISPQVWAWRKYRIHSIKRLVDRMLVILPFEEDFYRNHGIEAEYVGHPLIGVVRTTATREEFAKSAGLDPERPFIALLPGSRQKEIHYHMPALVEAAKLLATVNRTATRSQSASAVSTRSQAVRCDDSGPNSDPAALPQFVIPVASTINPVVIETFIDSSSSDFIKVVKGNTYNALGHAAAAVVASGTATVEAALLGTPMIIIYRGSELNWRLIRPLIHLDTFGMVNLIAGRKIVPELIQHDVTGPKIAEALGEILSSPSRLSRMKDEMASVVSRLSGAGLNASEVAARRVIEIATGK